MPNNYTFLDSNSSVQTAATSIVGGAHQPLVQIASFLSIVPTTFSGSPSISGAVTIVGNPSISGTVNIGTQSGSIASFPQGTIITSIVSTVPSSVLIGTSIFGQLPGGTAMLGSVAAIVTFPTNQNVSGSVVAFQGAGWSGSVAAALIGTNSSSVYGMRNDAVASFLGADLTERPIGVDSAGRILAKPFAAEESRVEGYASVVSTSVTTLVAAAGAGLRNYITDLWFANTDGTNGTLITLKDGAGSILGYTIAPSKSGSNLPGLQMPIRTGANATFDFQPTTAVSILYATVKGYKAP